MRASARVLSRTERLAPLGQAVTWAEPRTEAWYEARRGGVTASDAAIIMGTLPYKSPLELWRNKLQLWLPGDTDSHPARFGRAYEDGVMQVWCEDHPMPDGTLPVAHKMPLLRSTLKPWLMASPDRALEQCPAGLRSPCGVEIKTRSAYKGGAWSADTPDDVLAQTLVQAYVAGWDHVHVACEINHWPHWRLVEVEPDLTAFIIRRCEEFWRCVQEQVEPEYVATDAAVALLEALFPNRDGAAEVDPAQAAQWRAQYAVAAEQERVGKATKKQLRNEMVAALGAGDRLVVPGSDVPVATYHQQAEPTLAVGSEDLARLATAHPRIYARLLKEGFVSSRQPRTLRWTKAADTLLGLGTDTREDTDDDTTTDA